MKSKAYFVSDLHLGAPDKSLSDERERRAVRWLDYIKDDAAQLFLLGDIFDFWYEWRRAVPKGFVRFLAKLAELRDSGTEIYFFTGNHDIWAYHYLNDEIGAEIIRKPQLFEIQGKKLYLGHGDGLGHHDRKYKIMKAFFTNRLLQWMFSNMLHPDFALWLGSKWSLSRDSYNRTPEFLDEKEWLVEHIREIMPNINADYYVFGHRHCAVEYQLEPNIKYINPGVWFKSSPYAELSEGTLFLKNFDL